MNPSMVLGSAKSPIGHRLKHSGQGTLCLPELWGAILPAATPLTSCFIEEVHRGSASSIIPRSQHRKGPTQDREIKASRDMGTSWHVRNQGHEEAMTLEASLSGVNPQAATTAFLT